MRPILLIALAVIAVFSFTIAEEDRFTPGGKWRVQSMERPRPRVVTPPTASTQEAPGQPPSDAIVLFDGKDFSKWMRYKRRAEGDPAGDAPLWKLENGSMQPMPGSGDVRTREKFTGDTQWHIEWATPAEVKGESQMRGNSGIFLGDGIPEIQVLDSYQNDTYPDGQAASLYTAYPPMVNASRKPGEWQSYDIIIERQRKDEKGNVIKKARLSLLHNGVVVQWGRELDSESQESHLGLQEHAGDAVRYRNIWVRPINLTDPDSDGTPPPQGK